MPSEVRPVPCGRRIAIYGPSGSGKSTVSKQLAEKLGLPVLELDAVFHAHPNWVDLTREEFREQVTDYLGEHSGGWVIEGNYGHVRDLVLPLAETAIWLDLPFATVYRRLAARTVTRSITGGELWNGNKETLRQTFLSRESMLIWGFTSWRAHRASITESLITSRPQATVYHLRTPGQVSYLIRNAVPAF
ncbi:MAG: AAA family ATPase [bacterium]